MSKENGKYVYDLITIRKIVDEFDFTEVNQLLNQTWTNESFFEEAIKGISEAEFPAIQTFAYTKGPMCNVDKKDSIWNSRREYRSKNNTSSYASKLRLDADSVRTSWALYKATNSPVLAALVLAHPGLSGVILASGLVKTGIVAWLEGVANSITNSNKKNNCGTVLDINMVGWYSSWNQIDN